MSGFKQRAEGRFNALEEALREAQASHGELLTAMMGETEEKSAAAAASE